MLGSTKQTIELPKLPSEETQEKHIPPRQKILIFYTLNDDPQPQKKGIQVPSREDHFSTKYDNLN